MPANIDFTRLAQVDLAAVFGVTPRAVRDWDECPRNDDDTYNLPDVIAWRMANGALDLNAERARLAKEQADRTAMANAVERGELLRVATVATEWGRMLSACRAKLLAAPTKLAPRLAKEKTPVRCLELVTTEIYAALHELSNYRPGNEPQDDEGHA